ncbi:uncharacterized protein Tco025E_03864 [Trypanosoma conorhini]|uniref:Uncharacterized protein n=1 Tax=Trypanosoma conorhini TaxID=83891 RepID=A0A3R7PI58_9TRYP|nr:uncharacterized protein Tco025E_03864 [Trypanosoma conorhini]RNF20264.1 hypothetical protein Tco025E_03864 [Trypanosoma conorhini]
MSASAYHVANLLRQDKNGVGSEVGRNTLAKLTRDVEAFLARAVDVPPVVMETSHEESEAGSMEVQLSVVAGVLEPREPANNATAVDGVLLPTAKNHATVDRQRVREAQAMLNLLSALSTSGGAPAVSVAAKPHPQAAVEGEEMDGVESDDESIAVFDADELAKDTSSSEDESDAQRRPPPRILELN